MVSSGNEEEKRYMGKHLKQKSAPVKAENEKRRAQEACEICAAAQDVLRYDRAGSYEVQPRRVYPG